MKKINVFNDIISRENINKKDIIKNDEKQEDKKNVNKETEKEVNLGKRRRKTKRK